ncbi:MAG: hypothetical protein E7Z63_02095 [Thermoplasmata archaeon]|nr:hypothetical protein [Thermoplasmata archaeon]
MIGKTKIMSISLVLLLLGTLAVVLPDDSEADGPAPDFLLDYGNGATEWYVGATDPTLSAKIYKTLTDNGHTVDLTSPEITVDGKGPVTIGLDYSGGSFESPGTTGVKVTSSWHVFNWDGTASKWAEESDLSKVAAQYVAIAYYPDGVKPAETPDHNSAWSMIGGDSWNSFNQVADLSQGGSGGDNVFEDFPDETISPTGVYSSILYAKGYAFVKFGYDSSTVQPAVVCYDTSDWSKKWTFSYPSTVYETTTALVVDDYIYVQSMEGYIYRINYIDGPGTDNCNVTTFYNQPWGSNITIPSSTNHVFVPGNPADTDTDTLINQFFSSITASTDAGAIADDFLANVTVGTWAKQSGGSSASTGLIETVTDTRGISTERFVTVTHYDTEAAKNTAFNKIKAAIEDKKDTSMGTLTWTEYTTTVPSDITFYAVKVQTESGMMVRFVMSYGNTIIDGNTHDLLGSTYGYGAGALVYDSGTIFAKCSNGMVYALNMDLELIWSFQCDGKNYFRPVTVYDGIVYAGAYDGYLYALDMTCGDLLSKVEVCHKSDETPGCVNAPAVKKNGANYTVFITYSDDGTGSAYYGYAIYSFDGTTFTQVFKKQENTGVSTFLTHYNIGETPSVILSTSETLGILTADGTYTEITDFFQGEYVIHVSPVFVNNTTFYVSTYNQGSEGSANAQSVYSFDLEGKITGRFTPSKLQYAMSTVTVVNGLIMCGNDAGMYAIQSLSDYTPETDDSVPLWETLLAYLVVIFAILVAFWAIIRFGLGWKPAFATMRTHIMTYFFGENYLHNTRSKRKLRLVMLIGILMTLGLALLSLCVGSETTVGVGDAISAMISSIQKGGQHLDKVEMLIYNQRLPRALATICVGIGLSIAGAVYQAVIKNPLVEPYIMGVSSGAGTFAIAVITYGFTFFGLLSPQNSYLIAVAAILGGLTAFGLTMLLAVKTGGKSVNYILSGIIIGLVFSAAQSIMMIGNGTKAANALSWLYGSFINISWDTVWIIVFPCLFLSLIPLFWAKELNLVLLGEDQAMQMGLDAKKFDMIMLIVVSVLTAFCVAFCGIIGFVGLVIPHLSRLLLGGDHRLMLPASMAFGGCLLLFADLISRVLISGYELPVGAITTIIGVPVFAYLLVKRGRSYND